MGPSPVSPRAQQQVDGSAGAAEQQAPSTASPRAADKLRKRHVSSVADGGISSPPSSPTKATFASFSKPGCDDDIEEVIRQLPDWKAQLSLRGYIVGTALGVLFIIIGLKLSLGTAGIIPSLNIPGGLISFAAIKSMSAVGSSLSLSTRAPLAHRLLFQPFGLQENAVMQTFVLSMGTGGFGSYITGMGYQAYLNMGGAPRGTPGFHPESVYDPVPSKTVPFLLMISVLGAFLLTQMRKLMICDWRLPFPSGTASGLMLTSFHTANGEAAAIRKVKVLSWTGVVSFAFSTFKWFFTGSDYACGFGVWPTFGLPALKYTWNFDWQMNYVGAGMICPHIVNWSMLVGAILSWGIMWPLMSSKEGDWFPKGLNSHDFQGLFGYKVFLVIAILMGEGLYMVCKVLYSSGKDTMRHVRESRAARNLPQFSPSSSRRSARSGQRVASPRAGAGSTKDVDGGPLERSSSLAAASGAALSDADDLALTVGSPRSRANAATAAATASAAAAAVADGVLEAHHPPHMDDGLLVEEEESERLLEFRETPAERRLRSAVFLREVIPWWLAPVGYGGLAVLSIICIPMVYTPVRWYYVAVAYLVTPLFALPNSYGCGLTDWDTASMWGKLSLFVFAAWAGAEGNGVIVGLAICGVVLSATSSAATLMGDFRTSYICLAAPRAMFVAQLVGQLLGAVLTPMCFMLFFQTGQVNVPGGPYPAPFADIYRGMAEIGTKGFGALPKHCTTLMGAFFSAGVLLCIIRDAIPKRVARWVPSPMAMSIPFYVGANSAINFWLGSVVMHVWEAINRPAAEELGATVGAGLLVGDGLWAIPSSLLAMAGKAPPLCLGFWDGVGCKLPYCAGIWPGSSKDRPM